VRDVPDRQRFEIVVDGELAGHAAYRRRDREVTFHHTETDPRFEGNGLGTKLVEHALDASVAAGDHVIATCWFVAEVVARHPDRYGSLTSPGGHGGGASSD